MISYPTYMHTALLCSGHWRVLVDRFDNDSRYSVGAFAHASYRYRISLSEPMNDLRKIYGLGFAAGSLTTLLEGMQM